MELEGKFNLELLLSQIGIYILIIVLLFVIYRLFKKFMK